MIVKLNTVLLDDLTAQAKASPRLRTNYNLHHSMDSKAHRFFNAMEPGTVVDIHRHPHTDETILVLRGRVKVSIYGDDKTLLEVHDQTTETDSFGFHIPAGAWHQVECLETGTILFEIKDGPYIKPGENDVLK